jgi:cell division protein ZapE
VDTIETAGAIPSDDGSERDLLAAVDAAARDAGFTLEPEQLEVVRRLAALPIGGDEPAHLYLWGAAGRGKTWLLDAFFAALPTPRRRRVHFHSFFRGLHASIHRLRTEAADAARATGEPGAGSRAAAGAVVNAVEQAVDELLDDVEVVLFDEFHVHDPGDGMLMIRLLEALFARQVTLLTSSNFRPQDLLPDPVYHHLFEPGIAMIEANMTVVELAGSTDHRRSSPIRRRDGFARGSWSVAGEAADAHLAALGLNRPGPDEATTLAISGHTFHAAAAGDGTVWFTGAELLERPTSVGDYLAWAADYDRWVLDALPASHELTREARARFVHLVDALCDLGVELHVVAATDRETFITAPGLGRGGFAHDAVRTRSRLALLRGIG